MLKNESFSSIKTRIWLLVLLCFMGMSSVFFFASWNIHNSLVSARRAELKKLVDTSFSLIQNIDEEGSRYKRTEEDTKREVLNHFRTINYGKDGYYWISDINGQVLLNPIVPTLEGIQTPPVFDKNGKDIFGSFSKIAKEKGAGFETYYWPPNDNAKLKVSYFREYKKWGWIIGTGIYMADIEQEISSVQINLVLALLIIAVPMCFLAYLLGHTISGPILSLNNTMHRLANGDLAAPVDGLSRQDEIGSMAKTVQSFKNGLIQMSVLEQEQKGAENLKSEFISAISHELRTPLTSIRGSLGLVVSGAAGELPEKIMKLVTIANKNCERLILLINDILDIDKIAAGDMRFDSQNHSANELLFEAVEQNRPYAEKYCILLMPLSLREDETINVDGSRFQQVMANFLSNAAKFSPGGAKVEVGVTSQNCRVRFSIKDYGLGIPNEFRARIFRKFSQADSSTTRKRGGTGLGLYISKQIIEQMGGVVGFDSVYGLGSTFWVEFPAQECCLQSTKDGPTTAGQNLTSSSKHVFQDNLPVVLHIEPDADFGQFIEGMFHERAIVINAKTISNALDFLDIQKESLNCSLALLDTNVNDMQKVPDLISVLKQKGIKLAILSTEDSNKEIRSFATTTMIKSQISDKKLFQTIMEIITNQKGL